MALASTEPALIVIVVPILICVKRSMSYAYMTGTLIITLGSSCTDISFVLRISLDLV